MRDPDDSRPGGYRFNARLQVYDPESVGRFLGVRSAQETPDMDPIKTAAIIPGVFGSVAIPMRNFPVSARWSPVYKAINKCSLAGACEPTDGGFASILRAAQGKGFHEKLAGINSGINRLITYRNDRAVYGSLDHWAKPAETLLRRVGDCEDFAILKMAALLGSGIPARTMSLVVLQDRKKGVFHAVLSVSTGSGTFILDNVRNAIVKDTDLPEYLPLYSFSVDRAWIHGSRSGKAQMADFKGGFAAIVPGEGPDQADDDASAKPPKRVGWRLRTAY